MNDLGFDVRGYCERLAACSDRFDYLFEPSTGYWQCNDLHEDATVFHGSDSANVWAFFGTLADERKGKLMIPLKGDGSAYELCTDTLLESIIAAVVESFESEVKS